MNVLSKVKRALVGSSAPRVEVVKRSAAADELAAKLRTGFELPPTIGSAAKRVSQVMEKDDRPFFDGRYATVAAHFSGASSNTRKLALLAGLVRSYQPESILEIGTAYGLSGIALAMSQAVPRLVTLEFADPQATLGPANIRSAVPSGVEAIKGDKNAIIPQFIEEGRKFDFVFHDGGHDGDGYVRDFDLLQPAVEPGGIYLIDDIAWDDKPNIRERTKDRSARTCFEGWQEVLRRERVSGAVVYNGNVGLLLLR